MSYCALQRINGAVLAKMHQNSNAPGLLIRARGASTLEELGLCGQSAGHFVHLQGQALQAAAREVPQGRCQQYQL